jgi:four helix bundle protein
MSKVQSFKDLIIWHKSHQLTLKLYQLTKHFPNEEKFGITSQIRRAAYSIPSNIVEGHSRNSEKEFKHFLSIARGSLSELEYFLILSKDLNYISIDEFKELEADAVEISKILYSFTNNLKAQKK